MAKAISSQSGLAGVLEETFGNEPATPEYTVLRQVSNGLNLERNELTSEERRSDRQFEYTRLGRHRVSGPVEVELSYLAYLQYLRHALRYADYSDQTLGDAAYVDTGSENFTLATGADTLTRSAGNWVTDGFVVNQMVHINLAAATFHANNLNLVGRISVVTATVLTFDRLLDTADATANFTAEGPLAAGASTIIGYFMQNDETESSFTLEREFSDITTGDYEKFTGMKITTMDLNLEEDSMVTATMNFMGKAMTSNDTTGDTSGTYTAADSSEAIDTFSGRLLIDGTAVGIVSTFSLSINNNTQEAGVVGQNTIQEAPDGRVEITGSMGVYFEDNTYLNYFLNETYVSVEFALRDPSGNEVNIWMPRCKYTGASKNVSGDDLIIQDMPFRAVRDSTYGRMIFINVIPQTAAA